MIQIMLRIGQKRLAIPITLPFIKTSLHQITNRRVNTTTQDTDPTTTPANKRSQSMCL